MGTLGRAARRWERIANDEQQYRSVPYEWFSMPGEHAVYLSLRTHEQRLISKTLKPILDLCMIPRTLLEHYKFLRHKYRPFGEVKLDQVLIYLVENQILSVDKELYSTVSKGHSQKIGSVSTFVIATAGRIERCLEAVTLCCDGRSSPLFRNESSLSMAANQSLISVSSERPYKPNVRAAVWT